MLPLASEKPQATALALPAVPVLAVTAKDAALLTPDGEILRLSHERAQMEVHGRPVLVCHAPYTRQRLGAQDLLAFDVLELFAFVHPAKFCVPTPAGLSKALGLNQPQQFEDLPFAILESSQALLADLQKEPRLGKKTDPLAVAAVMGLQGKGWNWTPFVFAALGQTYDPEQAITPKTALAVWKHLPEWAEEAPPPPATHYPVSDSESRARLAQILGAGSESRPQQADYAAAIAESFAPRGEESEPHLVLAEAGTGVGKTAGYLAPASVWAEKNKGAVWISTYTRNLQRQIGQELDRLYPDPALKDAKTAVRKGRENYLCLLNLEDMVNGAALARHPVQAVAAGLMARWAETTKDGDLQGGDFPGWLAGLIGPVRTRGLADRRGECIYAACDHYHKCFVERSVRKSKHAGIVVANHALVLTQTALAGPDADLPQRYIFDEGHHLFDAADSAFAAHLSARQTAELRRWILGPEGGKRSRARGLARRVEDLIAGDEEAESSLREIIHAAHALAGPGWEARLKELRPMGATEEFLQAVAAQVFARAKGGDGPYSLETDVRPLSDEILAAARKLKTRLNDLRQPLRKLAQKLRKNLHANADTWDSDTRKRVESVCAGIERRSEHAVAGWIAALESLEDRDIKNCHPERLRGILDIEDPSPSLGMTDAEYADWFEVERSDGHARDVGLYRHWIDPMIPFAAAMKPRAHGIAITSATLRDRTGNDGEDWRNACTRTGAAHLSSAPVIFSAPSPYDYAAQTRIFIVTGVNKNDVGQVASAYRVLFEAAGGGSLGLFTAIQRLRAVHQMIAAPLEERDIRLYAQHCDAIDTGTLVDIFREDTHACLLGTDAVRDGIDVPGDALRLLVYDRVPWPRPTILHRARQERFGRQIYDDMTVRGRLRQAYGRLIRRATDRGVFVLLDSGLPSRLLTAFPEGVEVQKLGLAETAAAVREFLNQGQVPIGL